MKKNPLEIPDKIQISPGKWIKVSQQDLPDLWGLWLPDKREIVIHKDQSEEGKWLILLHELMHVAETELIKSGIIKKGVTHDFITYGAVYLFAALSLNGFLKPIGKKRAEAFFSKDVRPYKL